MIPRIRIALALVAALVLTGQALPSGAAPADHSTTASRRIAVEQGAADDTTPAAARERAAGGDGPVDLARKGGDDRKQGKDKKRKKKPKCFGKKTTVRAVGATLPVLTAGDDTVLGDGAANEVGESAGADRVCGGGGDDQIDARESGIGVDGRLLLARGGDGNDTLLGTNGDDRLFGDAGNDDLGGFAGRNELVGGAGDDFIASSGPDRLDGGPGNDTLNADNEFEPGADIVLGGDGDDTIRAVDGEFDLIDCGKGADTVEFDLGLDQISANCETLTPVP